MVKDWEQRKLGEVSDIIGGGTPSTKNPDYWGGDINWYSPAELKKDIFVDDSQRKITESGLKNSSARILPKGTVLFTSRAGIGNTAILAKESATNQGFQSIVPKDNILDTYFIYSKSHLLKRYGEIQGAGSTFVEISGKEMAKMPLILPTIKEQIRIGTYLKNLDNIITLHQRKVNILLAIKKAYLSKLFPRKDNNIPEIRFYGFKEVWEQCRLNSVYNVTMGHSPKSENYTSNPEDYILVQGNADIKNGWVKPRVWTTQITSLVGEGSILISVRAPVGNIGKTSYAVVIGRGIAAIEGDEFIYQLLSKMHMESYWRKFSTGSAFESINSKDIKEASIKLPDENERKKIGNFLAIVDSYITYHQIKANALVKLKKSYLNKMFL